MQNPLQKLSQGHSQKQLKKWKRNKKLFKKLRDHAIAIESTLNGLNETLIAAERIASTSTRLATTL